MAAQENTVVRMQRCLDERTNCADEKSQRDESVKCSETRNTHALSNLQAFDTRVKVWIFPAALWTGNHNVVPIIAIGGKTRTAGKHASEDE